MMQYINRKLFVILAIILALISTVDIVKLVVTTLFTNCSYIKSYYGLSYEDIKESLNLKQKKSDISFTFVNKFQKNTYALGRIPNTIPNYDPHLQTEILIHGFQQIPENTLNRQIIDALLKLGERNVIYIDCSRIISGSYMYSTSSVKFLGEIIGTELSTNKYVFNETTIHLISFSLGAQIAGFVGKAYHRITGSKISWITGLDPAGPCYFGSSSSERLSRDDAYFVDILHTNMGGWGTTKAIGHVDFYPNDGYSQPGCLHPGCSHERAVLYYAESILNPNAFMAVNCNDSWSFKLGACSLNERNIMGYGVSKSEFGSFCLQTNKSPFYAMASLGIPNFSYCFNKTLELLKYIGFL